MKRVLFLTFLLCLILSAPALYAGVTYYLYQPGMEAEIDVATYTATGEVKSNNGVGFAGSHKVAPGPAPAPYPTVYVWEKAINSSGLPTTSVTALGSSTGTSGFPRRRNWFCGLSGFPRHH